jgi:hypothetical protein
MKATNVSKQSKKPGKAWCGVDQSVRYCVAAFADYVSASVTLDNAKALWDAARMGLRVELGRAHKFVPAGRQWDAYKASVRAGLVKASVCESVKAAGRLVDNQLIALGITGNGTRKGGKRKGAGRPERTEVGEAKHGDAARICADALAYIVAAQQRHMGDAEMLEELGAIAAILGGVK